MHREKRNAYGILMEKPEERDQDVSGRIIKWILERQNEVVWTGLIWLRIGTNRGFFNMVINLRVP
jgi:hypothetical protein